MLVDITLEDLRVGLAHAFAEKQHRHAVMEQARFVCLSTSSDALIAYRAMRNAYATQVALWEEYLATRQTNRPLIDEISELISAACERKMCASDASRVAYRVNDHTLARALSNERANHEKEQRQLIERRCQLTKEIREARLRHEAAEARFQKAKGNLKAAKAAYYVAELALEYAQAEFGYATQAFEATTLALREYIDRMDSGDDPVLIERAGIPPEHANLCWTSRLPSGEVNFYFAGIGLPDGIGHAHYTMQPDGSISYARDPFEVRGPHNYIEPAMIANN